MDSRKQVARHIILSAIEDISYMTVSEMVFDSLDPEDQVRTEEDLDQLVDEVYELVGTAKVRVKFNG